MDPSSTPPRIAIITAGAAGMYCGSCLHDNAVAQQLYRQGVDVQLIPTYTPIRTDETDFSIDQVFFGGINVYLDQKVPLYHLLPSWLVGWLDRPAILKWATSRGIETDASQLGPMCISMLRGARGRMRREVMKLCRHLEQGFRPQLVSFSNVLISGSAAMLKQRLEIPIVVTLQGDDIFLEGLPEADRKLAIQEIQKLDKSVDRYVAHSQFYANKMSDYLGINLAKIRVVPLGVNAADMRVEPLKNAGPETPGMTIGYLARLAPEKGLHLICQAVERMRENEATKETRLRIAGWLGPESREYADESMRRLLADQRDEHGPAVAYLGVVDRAQKREFLSQIDVLCVPSPYEEPKGLYVLEALSAGVPVVSPNHGAFPELRDSVGGIELFRANDLDHLVESLSKLAADESHRHSLGNRGRAAAMESRTSKNAADAVMAIYRELIH